MRLAERFDPTRVAVVLLEFQQQWTEPGLYRLLIARQLRERAVIATTQTFVADARRYGALVVHAPLVLDPAHKRGLLAQLTRARVFTAGTAHAALTPGLWCEDDLLIVGRTGFDGFVDSTLERELLARGRDTLLVGGFATDQCVNKTLLTATRKGFDAWLLSDCSAALTRRRQRRCERYHGDRTLTAAQACAALELQPITVPFSTA